MSEHDFEKIKYLYLEFSHLLYPLHLLKLYSLIPQQYTADKEEFRLIFPRMRCSIKEMGCDRYGRRGRCLRGRGNLGRGRTGNVFVIVVRDVIQASDARHELFYPLQFRTVSVRESFSWNFRSAEHGACIPAFCGQSPTFRCR